MLSQGPRDLGKYEISSDYWKNWSLLKLFDFVEVVRNIDIYNLEPKTIKFFFWIMFFDVTFRIVTVFYKHETYNFISVIIHMENTLKAMQCQKCRKYFKKK